MTRDVVTVDPTMTLADALDRANEREIRHLPVLDGGALVGLVTGRDLRRASPLPGEVTDEEWHAAQAKMRVGDVMVTEVVTTVPDQPIEAAAKVMYQHRIGCLPVLDGSLVGIITERDVLRAFVELFSGRENSSRIELTMPDRPGELARVVRVIGIDHKVNITGLVIPPTDTDEALAIIHLQADDPEGLAESLTKLGYRVGTPSLDSDRPE